jgi:hypothetical protein
MLQVLTTRRLLAAVVIVGAGIIVAGVTAGLVRARLSENEASALRADNDASAIGALRAIGAAEARYRQRCTGYANLSELIRTGELAPPGGLTGESTITTDGYKISVETAGAAIPITSLPPGCVGSHTDFFSHADPIALGRTGTQYFASDSRQTIFQDSAPMTYPPKGRPPQKPGS